MMQRVTAEINLDALKANLAEMRRSVEPRVRVMGVVKADAYGHGAVGVARHLEAAGIDYFGVGDMTEAMELRRNGVRTPILVLGAVLLKNIRVVVEYDITVVCPDAVFAQRLDETAARAGVMAKVHLLVDTGMGRLGLFPKDIPDLAEAVAGCSHLMLEGVFTHFPSSDREVVLAQLRSFRQLTSTLAKRGIEPPLLHAANSSAVFLYPDSHFDMVRPGIALYGIDPVGQLRRAGAKIRPVLRLVTEIVFLKDMPLGSQIGYRPGYVSPKTTRIATLPIGYDHGYTYHCGNRAHVLVRGQEAPVVGRISMDYTTIDVGHIEGAAVGDPVTIIGSDQDLSVRVEDLAQIAGAIPYEVTTNLGRRVRRVFIGKESGRFQIPRV